MYHYKKKFSKRLILKYLFMNNLHFSNTNKKLKK